MLLAYLQTPATELLNERTWLPVIAGNYITGDRDKNDHQLNTYNLLFSKPQYGLTAPIGATNIITLHPYLKISPLPTSSVSFGASFMWRQSNNDGTYSPGAVQTRPSAEYAIPSLAKELGTMLVIETSYTIHKNISFAVDASKFFAGKFVTQTGFGKDIGYLSFKAGFKF